MNPFGRIITAFIGAAFFWIIKGFRTDLYDELADKNIRRNAITGLIICALLILYWFGKAGSLSGTTHHYYSG